MEAFSPIRLFTYKRNKLIKYPAIEPHEPVPAKIEKHILNIIEIYILYQSKAWKLTSKMRFRNSKNGARQLGKMRFSLL